MFNNSSFSILVVSFLGLGPTFRESVVTEMTTRLAIWVIYGKEKLLLIPAGQMRTDSAQHVLRQ
jgi:hypothetical protein